MSLSALDTHFHCDAYSPMPIPMPQAQIRRLRLYLVRHGESEANQQGVFAGQLDSPLTEQGVIDAKSLGERSEFLIFQPPGESNGHADLDSPQTTESSQRGMANPFFFDEVYSSDLTRAQDTCKLILEGMRSRYSSYSSTTTDAEHEGDATESVIGSPSHNIRLEQRLRERSYGTLQGMPWSSDRSETDKIWMETHAKDDLPPIFETDDDIWTRVKEFLTNLMEDDLLSTTITDTDQQRRSDDATTTTPMTNDKTTTKHILITSHGGVLRQILMRLVPVDKLKKMGAVYDTKRKNRLITPNASLSILDFSVHCQQSDANPTKENGEKEICSSRQNNNASEKDGDNDELEGIKVQLILFANTDHLKTGFRIHDD